MTSTTEPATIQIDEIEIIESIYDRSVCGFCKNFTISDEFPTHGTCSREGLRSLGDQTCFWYGESTRNKFLYFWHFEWDDNLVYFTTDFTEQFNITRHLSRHYLLDVLTYEEAKCFRAMISNRGYYFKRTKFDLDQTERYAKVKLLHMDT